ncbi:MAG: zinc-binding dehydrogenase [Myxococcales bacterium]|nr:zinc-binding dehydrogenase [Myxococcales bacterium]
MDLSSTTVGSFLRPRRPLRPRPLRQTQRVVLLREFGSADRLSVVDQPMPSPGPGEVRVRVLATSVQFTDVMIRKGSYPGLARQLPLVLGYDVVGEVDELGPGVAAVSVGDRVAALTVTGSHGRYRTLRAEQVVPVPKFVDPAEAVALVLSWTTAYQLLHRVAQVRPGQRMLVIGAGGAVGQALLTLGKRAGLEMWGTARHGSAELVRSLGATAVDFEAEDCRTLVRGGFDVVMDGIGERGFTRSWASVKAGGTLCAYGIAAAVRDGTNQATVGLWLLRLFLWDHLPNGKRARFYSITDLKQQHPAWFRADLEDLFALLADGSIHPRIQGRIDLDSVEEAHGRVEAGGLTGKLILCP